MAGVKGDMMKVIDPFAGNGVQFSWPSEVNVGQLQNELVKALGPGVQIAVHWSKTEDGEDAPVDPKSPLEVFVTPKSVDLDAVRKVMSVHRPDPYYGMSQEGRRRVQLTEKVKSGADLSMQEMQEALRMMVS